MAGFGVPWVDIAVLVGVDVQTLKKHCEFELVQGEAVAKAKLGQSLFEQAVGRGAEYDTSGRLIRDELKPDKSVAIFMGKARLGFRETSRVEHTGAGGGPIQVVDLDLTLLDDSELQTFMVLYEKCRRRSAGDQVSAVAAAYALEDKST